MNEDYIFCPLCGGMKWLVDKTGTSHDGRLTFHECSSCKNFNYTNETVIVKSEILIGVTNTSRLSVMADIFPYLISVYYKENKTEIMDTDSFKLLLRFNKVIQFNWYRSEEVIDKIKKFLVFS
jgi:hypothetical protein